jgi:membrane-associated protease RseP (regulator of RpoE activity)
MQFTLGRILSLLPQWDSGINGKIVAEAIEAMAPELTTDQAEAALRAILNAMFSRARLGVDLREVNEDTARSSGLAEPRGAFVQAVMSDSPAEKAKIKAGDIILAFDGKAIDTAPTLLDMIYAERPGKEVFLTLWCRWEKMDLTVTLGEDVIWFGEQFRDPNKFEALTAMAKALKALPVPITAEQAGMARNGILGFTPEHPQVLHALRHG